MQDSSMMQAKRLPRTELQLADAGQLAAVTRQFNDADEEIAMN